MGNVIEKLKLVFFVSFLFFGVLAGEVFAGSVPLQDFGVGLCSNASRSLESDYPEIYALLKGLKGIDFRSTREKRLDDRPTRPSPGAAKRINRSPAF